MSDSAIVRRLHDAHARLEARLEGIDGEVLRRPSALPGWSVAHVLAHLARNADSVVRRVEGAGRDEVVDQYPGGLAGREAEIEETSQLGPDELLADVRATSLAVEHVAAGLPHGAWERLSRTVGGQLLPVGAVLLARIREVEVHHVDLDLGYRPADWPAGFVQAQLTTELPKLAGRVEPAQLLAWLTGRGPAPELPSWP